MSLQPSYKTSLFYISFSLYIPVLCIHNSVLSLYCILKLIHLRVYVMYSICLEYPCIGLILSFPFSLYAVVVVLIRDNKVDTNDLPRNLIASRKNELPPPYDRMSNNNDVYTAAVWNRPRDVKTNFTLGDGTMTRGRGGTPEYMNVRLMSGQLYGAFYYIRLESDTGRVVCINDLLFANLELLKS